MITWLPITSIDWRYFGLEWGRNCDLGFSIGIEPVWIHRHRREDPLHWHILIRLALWWVELRIGQGDPDE